MLQPLTRPLDGLRPLLARLVRQRSLLLSPGRAKIQTTFQLVEPGIVQQFRQKDQAILKVKNHRGVPMSPGSSSPPRHPHRAR